LMIVCSVMEVMSAMMERRERVGGWGIGELGSKQARRWNRPVDFHACGCLSAGGMPCTTTQHLTDFVAEPKSVLKMPGNISC
jgi:hypothetical protein